MNLYVVRHGQTEGNAAQTHQTESTPLSQEGKRQAVKLASRFATSPIEAIIASPALRTRQTAGYIAEAMGKPIEFNDNLLEKRNPSEVDNKSWRDQEVRKIWEEIYSHSDDPDYHYSNEENFWDFIKRVAAILPQMESRNEENILLVSHGYVIKALIGLVLFGVEFSPRQFSQLIFNTQIKNTGVTVFSHDLEHGWQLVTYNDHAHLLD